MCFIASKSSRTADIRYLPFSFFDVWFGFFFNSSYITSLPAQRYKEKIPKSSTVLSATDSQYCMQREHAKKGAAELGLGF